MTDDPRTDDPQDGAPTDGAAPPGVPPVQVPPVGAPQDGDAPVIDGSGPPASDTTAPATAAPIAAPTVEFDMPCVGCGYNLRSIVTSGICPECGAAVADSFAHGWLVFADRGWLETLRGGFAKILWLFPAGFAAYIALILIFMLAVGSVFSGAVVLVLLSVLLGVAICVGLTWLWLKGLWAVTCPEPPQSGPPTRTPMIAWIRGLNVVSIVGFALLAVFMLVALLVPDGFVPDDQESSQPGRVEFLAKALAVAGVATVVIAEIAYAVSFFLLLIHLRRLARRDPRPGLAKMMTFLVWGSIGMSVAGFASVVLMGSAMFSAAAMPMAMAMGPTTFPTTTAATSSPVAGYGFEVSVSAGSPGTMSPPSPSLPTKLPTTMPAATMSTTSQPSPTSMPFAGPRPFPFRGSFFMVVMVLAIGFYLLVFAWCICALIALFWFRRILARAMEYQAPPVAPAPAPPA